MSVVKKNKINKIVTAATAKYIKDGYTIQKSRTIKKFPNVDLIKGKSRVTITVSHDLPDWKNINDVDALSVNVEKNGKLIDRTTFYQVTGYPDRLYTDRAQAQRLEDKMTGKPKTNEDNVEIPVTKSNVRLIRNVPGWKTVPMANIRLRKHRNSYVLSNAINKHQTIVNVKQ